MKINISILIIISCFYLKTNAQDPVFSQFFLVPETLNPGFSGFEDASYLGLIHRTQWPSLDLRVDTEYAFFNTWIEDVGRCHGRGNAPRRACVRDGRGSRAVP
ncbi:MAG: type IX secretion system membrane protein PorP/SprF, partial [Flavobacteriales bacterium]